MTSVRGRINYSFSLEDKKHELIAPKKLEKSPLYLVVRFSAMDDIDVLSSLQDVISKNGYCWFGKYGQKIRSGGPAEGNHNCTLPMHVILAAKIGKQGVYRTANFISEGMSAVCPSDGSYPSYYNDVKHRISTWIKLKPSYSSTISLKEVITISSGESVIHSLDSSTRGHFWCRLRMRN